MSVRANEALNAALQRLCKWRAHFAGWQLGSRSTEDPEAQAVRDHHELTMLMRVELNAITRALFDAGILTEGKFDEYVLEEAEALNADYERRWPGVTATDSGLSYDRRVIDWMKKWRP